MPSPRSLLIIKPGSLGDIVHALPAVADVAHTWPEAQITWIADRRWAPLLRSTPHIHRVIEFPRETFRGPLGWTRSVAWFRSLRTLRPDLAFDLQGLFRSALMGRACRARKLIGGSDAREGAAWFYDIRAAVDGNRHAVERYRRIVAAAGACPTEQAQFLLPQGERLAQPLPEQFVLLHPFARGQGKSLSEQQIRRLITNVSPFPVVLAGIGNLGSELPKNCINLLNQTTLLQFVWLARQAHVVISVDSGPAHIAAAVNPCLLVIHTWSDPRHVGPYSETAWIWQGGELRRQNLEPCGCLPREQRPENQDISRIADWVKRQFGTANGNSR